MGVQKWLRPASENWAHLSMTKKTFNQKTLRVFSLGCNNLGIEFHIKPYQIHQLHSNNLLQFILKHMKLHNCVLTIVDPMEL